MCGLIWRGNVELGDLATIRSGYQFREGVKPDPDGKVPVLQMKDVRDGQFIPRDGLVRVRFNGDFGPYLVRRGDVLFLSRGSRPFAVAVEDDWEDTIAANYFYIVRPRTDVVVPAYLAWYINQPPAQAKLKPAHVGSVMQIIPKSAFEKLTIELPPLDVQRRIVEVARLARREGQLLEELREARQKLAAEVCLRAAARCTAPGRKP